MPQEGPIVNCNNMHSEYFDSTASTILNIPYLNIDHMNILQAQSDGENC